jgi:hypothetical protein
VIHRFSHGNGVLGNGYDSPGRGRTLTLPEATYYSPDETPSAARLPSLWRGTAPVQVRLSRRDSGVYFWLRSLPRNRVYCFFLT